MRLHASTELLRALEEKCEGEAGLGLAAKPPVKLRSAQPRQADGHRNNSALSFHGVVYTRDKKGNVNRTAVSHRGGTDTKTLPVNAPTLVV